MAFFRKPVADDERGFGAELKALRELRHLSREELARLTGIHALLIGVFEDERVEELADAAYDARHVERLVAALDGRGPYFLQKYQALLAARGLDTPPSTQLKPRVRRRDFFVTSHALVFAGFLLVVALLAGYVIWQAQLVSAPPPLTLDAPAEGTMLTGASVTVDGETDPAASVIVNGATAPVDADGHFSLTLLVAHGLTTIQVQARKRDGLPSTITRHVTYAITQ